MSDDFDEFDIVHLDENDVNEIITWATSTAAMLILMQSSREQEEEVEADHIEKLDRLSRFDKAVYTAIEALPEVMHEPSVTIAQMSYDAAVEEEEQVEQFREELEGL